MSETSPTSTTFAGDSNPNAVRNMAWGGVVLFVVLAPVAVMTAAIVYGLFSMVRISHRVLGFFVMLYGVGLGLAYFIFDYNAIQAYVLSFLDLFQRLPEINGEDADFFSLVLPMFTQQAPLSILIGGLIGVALSWWRYFRRPVWVEMKFRMSPMQIFRKRKNIKDIENDKNTPPDGRTLGINDEGERIVQTEKESAAHTLILGGSGTGKTTTMMVGARDIIKRGESLLFIDMKGSDDVPPILEEYCERYGRPFYHWTSQNPRTKYTGPSKRGPAYYDPVGRGDSTRKTDLIMAGRDWSEDFYKIIIQNYLQNAFTISEGAPLQGKEQIDSIAEAIQLLDPMVLKKRSLKLVGDPSYDAIITEINHLTDKKMDAKTMSTLDSMRSQLGILRNSIQGQWLRKDPTGEQDINFEEVAHKGAVVVFSIDSGTYEENSRILGDLIIQDLKTVAGELTKNRSRYPLNVFVDEFSAIGSDNIVTLLARCRSAGIPVTISSQSLGDLRVVSEAFMDQLTGIVSSFIVHRPNTFKDAEVYAGFGGKELKYVHRESVEMRTSLFGGPGVGSGTGKGTLDRVEDFVISPTKIQQLQMGEMVYFAKSTGRIEHVTVIREAEMNISQANDHATPEEDLLWKPSSEEHVITFDKDDEEKYSIDKTINPPFGEKEAKEWNPNSDVEEHKVNRANLERILRKDNLKEAERADASVSAAPEAPNPATLEKKVESSPTRKNSAPKPIPAPAPRAKESTAQAPHPNRPKVSLPPLSSRSEPSAPVPPRSTGPSAPKPAERITRPSKPSLPPLPSRTEKVESNSSQVKAKVSAKNPATPKKEEKSGPSSFIEEWD